MNKLVLLVIFISSFIAAYLFTNSMQVGDVPIVSGNYQNYLTQADSNLILFTTTTCPICKKTKELFNAKGIEYKEYALDKERSNVGLYQEITGKDQAEVPVLILEKTMIIGFNQELYLRELNL